MTSEQEKFAIGLMRINPQDKQAVFGLALSIFPDNTSQALRVANEWPNDPEIKSYRESVLIDNEIEVLPTKADLCRSIWGKMHEPFTDAEQFSKLGKLYAEVRGFIEKPSTNINTNLQQVVNKVMIVRENGSNADWEAKLEAQQSKLLEDSK